MYVWLLSGTGACRCLTVCGEVFVTVQVLRETIWLSRGQLPVSSAQVNPYTYMLSLFTQADQCTMRVVILVGIYLTIHLLHTTHDPTSDMDAISLSVDPRVKAKIIELVNDGVKKEGFNNTLQREVDAIIAKLGIPVDGRVDARFYPSPQTIRNLRAQAVKALRLDAVDQVAVREMLETLQANNPQDTYLFRPYQRAGGDSKLQVFVQTASQKRMLLRYVWHELPD